MSQREYSTNPNTVRARERKARMNQWEKTEYNAKTADNKAVLRQLEIARDTESFQMMAVEEREELVNDIAARTMERRRKRGIDYDSKMRRFEEAQQVQQAADQDAPDDDSGGDDAGDAEDPVLNAADTPSHTAYGSFAAIQGVPAVTAPGYPGSIAFPGHQQPAPLAHGLSASAPHVSYPSGGEYVQSVLPYGEGGAPPRPPPQLQGFLQDVQTTIPVAVPAQHQTLTIRRNSTQVSAGQHHEAMDGLYVSRADFNEFQNSYAQLSDMVRTMHARIEHLENRQHHFEHPPPGAPAQSPYGDSDEDFDNPYHSSRARSAYPPLE